MSNGIKVLSLFDGISCGRVALDYLGIDIDKYYASEIDKYAIQVSEKNYPDIVHIGNVMNIDTTLYKGNIDLLIGGSPCTNFSYAGNKKGASTKDNVAILSLEQYLELKKQGVQFEGQSFLFWEYIRILREIKPTYFLLENVKMKKEWEDVITKEMGVKPIRLNSNLFSAQNRDRLYWTNIPVDNTKIVPNTQVLRDIVRIKDNNCYHLTEKHKQGFLRSYNWKGLTLDQKSKPLLASYYKQPPHCPYIECKESESGYRMLSPIECERLQTLPDNYTEGISRMQRYKCIGNGWTVNTIAFLLSSLKGSY